MRHSLGDVANSLVQLASGAYRVPTFGDYVNSYLLLGEQGDVTLIDTGLKFAPARLIAALRQLGKDPADVTSIVLTHAHSDHAGGAARMVGEAGLTGVAIHPDDAPFLLRGRAPGTDDTVPGGRIVSRFPNGRFTAAPIARQLHDREILVGAGGLEVFHTPGHTPGHVSLLHSATGLLITGDALFNVRSRLSRSIAQFCTSFAEAKASAAVLADLDFTTVGFMHGPEIRSGAREAVRGFLRRELPRP